MDLKNKFDMVDEIDVDNLMQAVEKQGNSENSSKRLVGEGLYRREALNNQPHPVNKPSWNGTLKLFATKTSKRNGDEDMFRCGR